MKFYTEEEIKSIQLGDKIKEILKDIKPKEYFMIKDLIKELGYKSLGGDGRKKISNALDELGFKTTTITGKIGKTGGNIKIAWKE